MLDDGSFYGKSLADVVRRQLAARSVHLALDRGYTPDAATYGDVIRNDIQV